MTSVVLQRYCAILAATGGLLLTRTSILGAEPPGRIPWTMSRVSGTPEPPLPYSTQRLYPELEFRNPVDMAREPGSERLYILELDGKLWSFLPGQPRHLVLDAHASVPGHSRSYGLTFHPQFEQNRQMFLSYVLEGDQPSGTHVSRFRITTDDPPVIEPQSEELIITWHSGGHNGANLKFGPDGFLYISAGDGGPAFPPDPDQVGQDLGDLRSTIFRIDIDQAEESRPYAVPKDNPFVDLPGARPEIWAYGFRNPWKMCFDTQSGDLWTGDVGWELWELIYRVVKGGNYGWAVMEGRQPVRADVTRGPTPIFPPIVDHPHTEARSITGGYVYRGTRLPELQGAYIYGDYVTGKIWGLRTEGDRVVWHQELAETPLAVITFGEDQTGELFVVDYAGGIYQLIPNPRFGQTSNFPTRLSDTGLFEDTPLHRPAPGVYSYDLVAEPWMNGATAERLIALPDTTSIETARNREQWQYPPGTVFAKSISLPMDVGDPSTAIRLETQLLHFDGEQWRPYTYIWNDDQTDALLAPGEGDIRRLPITDSAAEGGVRTLSWRFHSRAECTACHTRTAGDVLGFFPQNLIVPDSSSSDNQLAKMTELELFAIAFKPQDLQPAVCDPMDTTCDRDTRARTYLMLNCAHCHRRGGGGTAHIEFPIEHSLDKMRAIDAPPTQGTFNIPQARIIARRDPFRSVLYYRMATIGRGHMPQLGAQLIDEGGVALLFDWITSLPPEETLPESVAGIQSHEAELIDDLETHPDHGGDELSAIDPLLLTTTGALRLVHAIDSGRLSDSVRERIVAAGAGSRDPVIRDLFERYLPEAQRTRRLGSVVRVDEILHVPGDIERGRMLFHEASGMQCRNCHQVEGRGKSVGPALDDVGRRLQPVEILESILDPSRKVDAKWVSYSVATKDGQVLSGLLTHRDDQSVVLRDIEARDHELAVSEIDELLAQQKSLMPELLFQEMTAKQLADLLAYLSSLRQAEPSVSGM